jgi:NAD(P)H dehydrogenase (quinone)
MKNPLPRIRMVDGFNEGWIDFESGQSGSRKAGTTLQAALQALVSEKQS